MQTETDLQYPIGKFHRHGALTDELRARYIEQIEILPGRLRDAVSGLNEKQLETPYRPGGWTVRQVVHHVADSHMNAYIRFKLTLTEDEPLIKTYLEAKWAELPDAKTEPVEVSLKLLEALHVRWVKTLRTMGPAQFARTMRHPEWSKPMSLDDSLALYAWHGKHHVAHIAMLRQREGWL
jgi:uncharacterized damage-inducible protein DinB